MGSLDKLVHHHCIFHSQTRPNIRFLRRFRLIQVYQHYVLNQHIRQHIYIYITICIYINVFVHLVPSPTFIFPAFDPFLMSFLIRQADINLLEREDARRWLGAMAPAMEPWPMWRFPVKKRGYIGVPPVIIHIYRLFFHYCINTIHFLGYPHDYGNPHTSARLIPTIDNFSISCPKYGTPKSSISYPL